MSIEKLKEVVFYLVMNSDGQFFRRKGYGGYGKTWVDDPATARIYVKIGQARSIVTFFANSYPKYSPPKIVKVNVGCIEVLDESERIAKAKFKKEKAKANQELRQKQWELEQAQIELAQAEEKLSKANQAYRSAKK